MAVDNGAEGVDQVKNILNDVVATIENQFPNGQGYTKEAAV
jgi:hypothetical protein